MLETERQQRLAIFGHSSNELKSERGTNRWRSPSFTWLHSNVQQTIGRTTYLLKCKRKALFFPRAFQLISTTNGHFTIIRVHLMAATEIPGHHRCLFQSFKDLDDQTRGSIGWQGHLPLFCSRNECFQARRKISKNNDFSRLWKDSTFEDPYNISTLKCIFSTFDIFWLSLPARSATQTGLTWVPAKAKGSISRASWLSFSVRSFSGIRPSVAENPPCNWPTIFCPEMVCMSNPFQPFCWSWHLWLMTPFSHQQPTKRTGHLGNPLQLLVLESALDFLFPPLRKQKECWLLLTRKMGSSIGICTSISNILQRL